MGFIHKSKSKDESKSSSSSSPSNQGMKQKKLKTDIWKNIQTIQGILGKSSDIVIREFSFGKEGKIQAALIYTDGLTDTSSLQNFIMETLMIDFPTIENEGNLTVDQHFINSLKDVALTVGELKDLTNFEDLFTGLLSGDTVFLIDGYSKGLIISNKQWEERGVTEPMAQTVVRGPREGFSENLRVNTALVRRKIKDPNLWIKSKTVGTRTKTNIAILYINGIANDKIVKELNSRLDRINIDGILESGNIEKLIQDSIYSPFPTIYNTERPDAVAAELLEGRIAIIVDGTPFVLIVPAIFVQFFQSPEDYYVRTYIGSLIRLLRFFSFIIALLAPSLFIAITTFHQAMLPPALLISLAAQREGVPFPAFFEALLMEIMFEILREAGIRMPRAVGTTMSIVGAFVIGTAAVEAGIISAAMVIVVSLTAITSFVSPTYDLAIAVRMLRFLFMVLAATFGLFGITVGIIALVLHLCSLRSFGIPYMAPLAPFNVPDQKDTLVVLPLWTFFKRPRLIGQKDVIRQQPPTSAKPGPDKE